MKTFPLLVIAFLLVSPAVQYAQTANTATASLKPVETERIQPSSTSEAQVEAQKSYDAAVSLYESGKLDEAIAALKDANRLRPDDPQTLFLMGMTYSQAKSYKDAAQWFKRATKFKPDWPEAYFRLGMVSYVLGRRNQSVDAYRKLLELNSPLANTLYRVIKEDNEPANVEQAVRDSEASATKPSQPMTVPASAIVSTASEPQPAKSDPVKTTPAIVPTSLSNAAVTPNEEDSSLTSVYRIGVGDVLDIRLLNSSVSRSSLFSVIDSGLIELPLVGGVLRVAGLTTEEVQARITNELKRRAVEEGAQVSVGVRQYSSHSVIITGLVNNQGTKFLRREAVPLYVILAEAQPRLDAARVSIMRSGSAVKALELNDSASLGFLVRSGDVINITARPQEFYYIAGRVNFPGQKNFQQGITLLQAILAAGGVARPNVNSIELSREGEGGLLSTSKFSLKDIKSGKVQDPKLLPGDRIEVVN